MSNRETLQENNSRLNVNNTDLSSILDTINNLPSVGQGGGEQNIKITDASYLFHKGARMDSLYELLNLCKNITTTEEMFSNIYGITTLDLSQLETSNVTTMKRMFYSSSNFVNLNFINFNTSKVTNMERMFYYCSDLRTLNLSNFDMSKVQNISGMFNDCYKLSAFNSFKNLGKGYTQKLNNYSNYKLDLSYCSALTYESLIDVINNLYDLNLTYDVANGGTLYTQQLVLGSTNLAKLTAEEIAIATNKGWSVS